ncbi:MAG: hypothetical protein Q7R32_10475 [Dehalococcoidia bacterium]|nr:hypothetical protein [Dehalococcoidia bacterium]
MRALTTIGEWLVLLPLWRRIIKDPIWHVPAAIATGLAWFAIIVAISVASGGGDNEPEKAAAKASPTTTAEQATPTPEPTAAPTATPEPPEPTPTPTPVPEPVLLEGVGQTATEQVTPPASISVATFTHNGSSNFVVEIFGGDSEGLLINHIGPYQGSRPIFGADPVTFDIDADGAWSIRIEAIGTATTAAFSGIGDAASGLFEPPSDGPWNVSHDGESNFAVWAHCAGGSDLVQNEIGSVAGSTVIQFEDGPCMWEVEADGNWSLQPR